MNKIYRSGKESRALGFAKMKSGAAGSIAESLIGHGVARVAQGVKVKGSDNG